jgi:hypothetical protein
MVYSLGEWDIEPKSDGPYVLAAHAIAHERAEVERIMALKFNEVKGWSAYRESLAYEQAIRDCIAATESLHFPTDYGEWYGIEAMKGTLVCEHCNDNCHSQSGVMCDSPDALWPCETITILRALLEKP